MQRPFPALIPRLAFALLATNLGLYLAGMFGGFDFTDEGFYYLSFAHPENVSDSQSAFYLFGAKLFRLMGSNIIVMRFCTLLAILGGTLLFLRGTRQLAQRFAPGFWSEQEARQLTRNSVLTGSCLAYAISPVALSYNFQNAFCLLAAAGFLLGACAQPRGERCFDRPTLLALGGFGALVGLEFFIKFSSSVLLAAFGTSFFFLVSEKKLRQKFALVGLLLACTAAAALAYFIFFQSFPRWWAGLQGTLGAILEGGYATKEINRYAREITALYAATWLNFTPVWVVAIPSIIVVAALRAWPRLQAWLAAFSSLLIFVHLLWLVGRMDYYFQPGPAFFLGSLVLLAVLTIASRFFVLEAGRNCPPGRWRIFLAAGLFIALPYIGAFGTNNDIHRNCLYQLAPWFVIAALLTAELGRIWRTPWPSRLTALLLASVATSQFYHGYSVAPYRVAGGRSQQTVPTLVGEPATPLRLDPGTHAFITIARRSLHENGFKPGGDLLVLFDLPGFVFAMGGVSPGHPWYFYGDPHSLALDLMRLNFIEPGRRKRAFIVRNGFLDDSLLLLRQAGLNFPHGYERITPPMTSPFTGLPFEIWRPKPVALAK